ncbi:hypothetical protein BH23CHL2_BH23CHL2_14940 [soil metagenome]
MSAIGTWLPGPSTFEDRESVLGKEAPGFQLPDQDGNNVTLRRLTRTGPVLMHHYRGNW